MRCATFASIVSAQSSAKAFDIMQKTVFNVAEESPKEASFFKYAFKDGKNWTFLFFVKTPRARWLLEWSDDKCLIWSLIQWRGLLQG